MIIFSAWKVVTDSALIKNISGNTKIRYSSRMSRHFSKTCDSNLVSQDCSTCWQLMASSVATGHILKTTKCFTKNTILAKKTGINEIADSNSPRSILVRRKKLCQNSFAEKNSKSIT